MSSALSSTGLEFISGTGWQDKPVSTQYSSTAPEWQRTQTATGWNVPLKSIPVKGSQSYQVKSGPDQVLKGSSNYPSVGAKSFNPSTAHQTAQWRDTEWPSQWKSNSNLSPSWQTADSSASTGGQQNQWNNQWTWQWKQQNDEPQWKRVESNQAPYSMSDSQSNQWRPSSWNSQQNWDWNGKGQWNRRQGQDWNGQQPWQSTGSDESSTRTRDSVNHPEDGQASGSVKQQPDNTQTWFGQDWNQRQQTGTGTNEQQEFKDVYGLKGLQIEGPQEQDESSSDSQYQATGPQSGLSQQWTQQWTGQDQQNYQQTRRNQWHEQEQQDEWNRRQWNQQQQASKSSHDFDANPREKSNSNSDSQSSPKWAQHWSGSESDQQSTGAQQPWEQSWNQPRDEFEQHQSPPIWRSESTQ